MFIDVDRRYYVPEGSEYSAIDPPIEAGYQKLCGFKALQYVRYRLEDNDLVRAARQQDFVREARQKIDPGKLLTDPDYRFELLDVFKEYTTSDENLRSTDEVLDMMKTFLGAHDAVSTRSISRRRSARPTSPPATPRSRRRCPSS